ncbi:hypothetical protein EBESD8_36250 [Rhodococcus aetherivorans]|nr:hypothetical protein EBESD8_36250 [Rhodococcus aetherivorans]
MHITPGCAGATADAASRRGHPSAGRAPTCGAAGGTTRQVLTAGRTPLVR